MVYIAEAHAKDEWDIGAPETMCVMQPKTDEERIKRAKAVYQAWDLKATSTNMYCMPVNSVFEEKYAPWPFRMYVFDSQQKLAFFSEPKEGTTHMTLIPLRSYLSTH